MRAASRRAASCRCTSNSAAACRAASRRCASGSAAACRAASCRAASMRAASRRASSCRAASCTAAACSTARSCTGSPASRGAGTSGFALEALFAGATPDVGVHELEGTTNSGSLEGSTSMTGGSGIGGCAASAGTPARCSAIAASALAAASCFGSPFSVGLAEGAIATVRGAGDADGAGIGRLAAGCPTGARRTGSATGGMAGAAGATGGGTSLTLRSGASIRRSRQGKPKPGSPSPSPLNVRLNSSTWISSDSSSANASRLFSIKRASVICPIGGRCLVVRSRAVRHAHLYRE